MITSRRLALLAVPLVAAALMTAGCTAQPATPAPTSTASTVPDEPDTQDIEAAWIDGGRGIAVVTWGSSTCVPFVEEISAEGQRVSVLLADAEGDTACTKDLVPRASSVGLPSGVDPNQDVEVQVTYGELADDTELDALTGVVDPDSETDHAPSAGWFDDQGIVLLTWGSSTCPPQLEKVDQTDTSATATFVTTDQVCTMDMAPQLTILGMPNEHEGDQPLELVLTGGGLDATISVLG